MQSRKQQLLKFNEIFLLCNPHSYKILTTNYDPFKNTCVADKIDTYTYIVNFSRKI